MFFCFSCYIFQVFFNSFSCGMQCSIYVYYVKFLLTICRPSLFSSSHLQLVTEEGSVLYSLTFQFVFLGQSGFAFAFEVMVLNV